MTDRARTRFLSVVVAVGLSFILTVATLMVVAGSVGHGTN